MVPVIFTPQYPLPRCTNAGYLVRSFLLSLPQAKLVRQEAINIDAAFQRKVKQADVQRRMYGDRTFNSGREFFLTLVLVMVIMGILKNLLFFLSIPSTQSNNINKSRMTLLLTRQDMLDELFAASRKQLLEITKDSARYEKFLADALVQVPHC